MSDHDARGERIERLLGELSSGSSPHQWAKIEQLMLSMNDLYGDGLRRIVSVVREAKAVDEILPRLVDDELVSALLSLHELHPLPAIERIDRSLDRVRPYLASHGGGVEVLALRDDGTLELVLVGTCGSCASSRATVEDGLRDAVADAACDVRQVDVWERPSPDDPQRPLVQLKLRREGAVGT